MKLIEDDEELGHLSTNERPRRSFQPVGWKKSADTSRSEDVEFISTANKLVEDRHAGDMLDFHSILVRSVGQPNLHQLLLRAIQARIGTLNMDTITKI